ncbi:hypothetical protein Btru_057509 [Bulinus truncatus]|nr:hypothetical protein Btru_057509 [Bulinus truncatus]
MIFGEAKIISPFVALSLCMSFSVGGQVNFLTALEKDDFVIHYENIKVTLGKGMMKKLAGCYCDRNISGCVIETNQTVYLFNLIPSYKLHATRSIVFSDNLGNEHIIINCSLTLMNVYYFNYFGVIQCPAVVSTYSLDILIAVFELKDVLVQANSFMPIDYCAVSGTLSVSTLTTASDLSVTPATIFPGDISITPSSTRSSSDISADGWIPDDRILQSLENAATSSRYYSSISDVSINAVSQNYSGTPQISTVVSQSDQIRTSFPVSTTAPLNTAVSVAPTSSATPTSPDSAIWLTHIATAYTSDGRTVSGVTPSGQYTMVTSSQSAYTFTPPVQYTTTTTTTTADSVIRSTQIITSYTSDGTTDTGVKPPSQYTMATKSMVNYDPTPSSQYTKVTASTENYIVTLPNQYTTTTTPTATSIVSPSGQFTMATMSTATYDPTPSIQYTNVTTTRSTNNFTSPSQYTTNATTSTAVYNVTPSGQPTNATASTATYITPTSQYNGAPTTTAIYDATPTSDYTTGPTSTTTSPAAEKDDNAVLIIIICCVVLALLCIVIIIIFIISSKRRSLTRGNESIQTLTSS